MTLANAARWTVIGVLLSIVLASTALAIHYREGGGCVCACIRIPLTNYDFCICDCMPGADPNETR